MRNAIDASVKHILFLDSKISFDRSNFLTACPVVLQHDRGESRGSHTDHATNVKIPH